MAQNTGQPTGVGVRPQRHPDTAESLRGKPGDMIFIPPNLTHSYEAIGTGPARALVAVVRADVP